MTGKSIKPQSTMTAINTLLLTEQANQEPQLGVIGPIRIKHRCFYNLPSINCYSRWPSGGLSETPARKNSKVVPEHFIILNGLPQSSKTCKGRVVSGGNSETYAKTLKLN